jgi:hypothetical protein
MTDSSLGYLRFADYSVNLGSVPDSLNVSADIQKLAFDTINMHDFSLEHEVRSIRLYRIYEFAPDFNLIIKHIFRLFLKLILRLEPLKGKLQKIGELKRKSC